MRVVLYLLVIAGLCVAGIALAGGGSASDPVYIRKSQGTIRDQFSVGCIANTALLTTAQTQNALSIWCQNTDASKKVGICPRIAAAGSCDAMSKFSAVLTAGSGWTTDVSSPGDWSCNGIGGTVVVNCYVERFAIQPQPGHSPPTTPTPTPIPTQTAGPTPT